MHHPTTMALEMMLAQLFRHHGRTQAGGQTRVPAAEASQRCGSRYHLQDQNLQTFKLHLFRTFIEHDDYSFALKNLFCQGEA